MILNSSHAHCGNYKIFTIGDAAMAMACNKRKTKCCLTVEDEVVFRPKCCFFFSSVSFCFTFIPLLPYTRVYSYSCNLSATSTCLL